VEQRGLDFDRVMVYRCGGDELTGVVVALTVGWTRSMR
jgi:light-regulated signal transduction histidine kinase (bacteriophytochrome)